MKRRKERWWWPKSVIRGNGNVSLRHKPEALSKPTIESTRRPRFPYFVHLPAPPSLAPVPTALVPIPSANLKIVLPARDGIWDFLLARRIDLATANENRFMK